MLQTNKAFVVVIMIWISILTVWAVNSLTNGDQKSVHVTGVPQNYTPQQISVVQMDKDTVWVVDPNSNYIRVIKHNEDGYHITSSEMSFQEE